MNRAVITTPGTLRFEDLPGNVHREFSGERLFALRLRRRRCGSSNQVVNASTISFPKSTGVAKLGPPAP